MGLGSGKGKLRNGKPKDYQAGSPSPFFSLFLGKQHRTGSAVVETRGDKGEIVAGGAEKGSKKGEWGERI